MKTVSVNVLNKTVQVIEIEQTSDEIALEQESIQQAEMERVASVNYTDISDKLKTALADNKAYIAIASPLAEQRNEQVKALTKQVNKLIRMQIRALDSVE